MTSVIGSFREASDTRTVASTPMSHVSIEVGHLYEAELSLSDDELTQYFEGVRAVLPASGGLPRPPSTRLRTSTSLLLDDYSTTPEQPPHVLLPRLLAAADRSGVTIDYLGRESACVTAGRADPAQLMVSAIVLEPPEGTTGSRPPTAKTGWLCNGTRSPERPAAAMSPQPWRPPLEAAASPHSIFVDVQLWSTPADSDDPRERTWSCPALAAAWQLIRLGLLRSGGRPVWSPSPRPTEWPDDWQELPPLVQLNPQASAFTAYRTLSVLPVAFLRVEAAVRAILSQVAPDATVLAAADGRARAEGIEPPTQLCDRLGYAFLTA